MFNRSKITNSFLIEFMDKSVDIRLEHFRKTIIVLIQLSVIDFGIVAHRVRRKRIRIKIDIVDRGEFRRKHIDNVEVAFHVAFALFTGKDFLVDIGNSDNNVIVSGIGPERLEAVVLRLAIDHKPVFD